jgi:hypothetical protein
MEVGSGEHHYPDTVEEYYRRYYFEVLNYTINSISADLTSLATGHTNVLKTY